MFVFKIDEAISSSISSSSLSKEQIFEKFQKEIIREASDLDIEHKLDQVTLELSAALAEANSTTAAAEDARIQLEQLWSSSRNDESEYESEIFQTFQEFFDSRIRAHTIASNHARMDPIDLRSWSPGDKKKLKSYFCRMGALLAAWKKRAPAAWKRESRE